MKKILSVLLIISLLLCITACGKNKPSGRYNIESMSIGDSTTAADQLKEYGLDMYIVFNDDGTGILGVASGEESDLQHFTWTENKLISDDGTEIAFTFDGTSVTLSEEDTTIVFK